jgi:hypothetical protein
VRHHPEIEQVLFRRRAPDRIPENIDSIPDARVKDEPFHKYANRPYTVFGRSYVPGGEQGALGASAAGSWYGKKFHGQPTASGELYDMFAMTAAHPTFPIPSYAKVTNVKTASRSSSASTIAGLSIRIASSTSPMRRRNASASPRGQRDGGGRAHLSSRSRAPVIQRRAGAAAA